MRDIKFRAWDKANKTMYTDAINNCKDTFDMILKHPQIYEVMQSTGIKDKNNVEIYEGDIYNMGDKNIRYIVLWNDTGLTGKQVGSISYAGISFWQDTIEVIGNIYQNPELLEGD